MKKLLMYSLFLLLLGPNGCKQEAPSPSGTNQGNGNPNPNPNPDPEWLVPLNEIFDGGPGKDGIPSVDRPQFTDVEGGNSYLSDQEFVVGIKIGAKTKAYPHQILDWHEIVNDSLGGVYYSLNYCPLTGTASAWNRKINGEVTTFGVSGLLYNSNLIPYDRNTDSEWSQLLFTSIHGTLKGNEAELFPVIETTWKTWKEMYPDTEVMTLNTGYNRLYDRYPYGDYKTSTALYFPAKPKNERFHAKERFLAVIVGEKARTYRFTAVGQGQVVVRNGIFEGKELSVVGSEVKNFMVAYRTELLDGTQLNMSVVTDELPVVMQDDEGNKWDVFGEAVSGPRVGTKLPQLKQTIGYWFALASFYPDPNIFR